MLIKLLVCAVARAMLDRLQLAGDNMNLVYSKTNTRLMRTIQRSVKDQLIIGTKNLRVDNHHLSHDIQLDVT